MASRMSPLGRTLAEAGELVSFSGQALRGVATAPRYASEVFRQSALLIRRTTLFLAVMQAFFGFTIVNFAFFFLRTIGASDYVGLSVGLVGARVGCISMFGYVFCSKVACGIVAEIAAMKINEEIDGYEVEGVDPYAFIIGSRVAAALIYIPIAAIVSLAALTFGGFVDAIIVLKGLTAEQYYSANWSALGLQDLLYMCISIGVAGVVIVLTACFYGYRASGGPAAVGEAVARSLIVSLTLAHVIPAILTVSFYNIQNPGLNIGG